jgi:signal transduction histidine kinase
LNNVLKHANAKAVTITLTQDAQKISFEVADDGCGFDPVKACEAGCLGLRNMKERAQEMGAEFEIISHAGNGTKVIIRRPIP